jgi:hypothetical protein
MTAVPLNVPQIKNRLTSDMDADRGVKPGPLPGLLRKIKTKKEKEIYQIFIAEIKIVF